METDLVDQQKGLIEPLCRVQSITMATNMLNSKRLGRKQPVQQAFLCGFGAKKDGGMTWNSVLGFGRTKNRTRANSCYTGQGERRENNIILFFFSPPPSYNLFLPHDQSKSCYFYSPLSFSVVKDGSHGNADKQFLPTLKICLHCWLP